MIDYRVHTGGKPPSPLKFSGGGGGGGEHAPDSLRWVYLMSHMHLFTIQKVPPPPSKKSCNETLDYVMQLYIQVYC